MATTIDFAGGITSTRVKAEAGNDTITIDETVVNSTISGGAGNDSIDFVGGGVTGSKIVGQGGNDTFNFGSSLTSASATTFYFGNGDGDDKLYFAGSFTATNIASTGAGLTIAVDSSLGATSAYNFSAGAALSTDSTITFDTSGAGSIFVSGVSTITAGDGKGLANITFVTVSSSAITALV